MTGKITQRAFNEEMFYAMYITNLTETITVNPLVEQALNNLRSQGFETPPIDDEFDEFEYEDVPELRRLVRRFVKRFEKLTGYDFNVE